MRPIEIVSVNEFEFLESCNDLLVDTRIRAVHSSEVSTLLYDTLYTKISCNANIYGRWSGPIIRDREPSNKAERNEPNT